jgi:tetratricopeptide (TPR) repeat protein
MQRKIDHRKAEKYLLKGDKYLEKGKLEKALAAYKLALEYDPELPGLIDKLIDVRDRIGGDWNLEDFADTVSWTMEKQAQDHPALKQVHARLSPEWKKATELALRILTDPADQSRSDDVEELVRMGEVATRALVSLLLEIKQAASPESEQTAEDRSEPDEESTESPDREDVVE